MCALRLIPQYTVVHPVSLALSTARSISHIIRVRSAKCVRFVRLVLLPAVLGCLFQAHEAGEEREACSMADQKCLSGQGKFLMIHTYIAAITPCNDAQSRVALTR